MTYTLFYGLLALAALCLSIAPATRTLWKIGLLFWCNWIFCTFINTHENNQLEALAGILVDCVAVFVCFNVYFRHGCGLANVSMWIYLTQIGINGWYMFNQDYTYTMVLLNSLFILNALLICGISIGRLKENRALQDKEEAGHKKRRNDLPFISWRC